MQESRIIIEGVRTDNKKFRPSDWTDRICAVLNCFENEKNLSYSELVHPCIIRGEKCLVVAKSLEQDNQAAYEFILKFARDNDLKVQEDRRLKKQPVNYGRREGEWGYSLSAC